MRNIITTLFLAFLCFSVHAQNTSTVNIGLGRYAYESTNDINQYALNIRMARQINNIFSLSLNASIYNEGENEYTVFTPSETVTYVDNFGGYSATLNLDIFALGLANNTFQTHIGIGGGFLNEENYAMLGLLSGYIEQQVMLKNSNTLGLGFSLSHELDAGSNLSQFYFNIGKRL